ncbi:MAG: D-glycero-beta-D-manno-heptose 1,7-bisphosphate 7-phosphatase [Gammaproteobacteria bacterium]
MKTIVLDRDGVINHDSDAYIKNPDEWLPIAGSLEAIARLSQAGYRLLVATNQSGVARGLFDLERLNAIHQKMESAIQQHGGRLDGIYYCPHGPNDNCACRKPRPGLLLQMERELGIDLQQSLVVGDSLRDLQAAIAVGAKPVLVLTGKGRTTLDQISQDQQIDIYQNLADFAETLITRPLLD